MNKPRLLFVVESPFSERDRRRFGIDDLARTFDVTVLDATPIVVPSIWEKLGHIQVVDDRVTTVATHIELVERLGEVDFDAVVSILGVHEQRHAVYTAARRAKALSIEFQLGTLPGDDLLAARAVKKYEVRWKQLTHPLQSIDLLVDKIRRRRYRLDIPDVVVHGGSAARRRLQDRVGRFIEAHSLDYDLFVQRRDGSAAPETRRIATYLDQDLGYHADHDHTHLRSPVEPDRYYPELIAYLRHFERLTGLKIVIAPHPRANVETLRQRFPGLAVSQEPTVDLVRGSTCVLAHISTSISFAVLWRKPVIFLGGPQLMRSWYEPYVTAFADSLERSVLDTSAHDSTARHELDTPITLAAYERYIREYLCSRVDDGRRLWDLVTEGILTELEQRG